MDYMIAVAACVWMAPFLVLEIVRPNRSRWWRVVASAPFLVLVALVWTHRFSQDALFITLVFVLLATTLVDVVSWRRRRGQTSASTPER